MKCWWCILTILLVLKFYSRLETFLCDSTANYLADLVSVAFWVLFLWFFWIILFKIINFELINNKKIFAPKTNLILINNKYITEKTYKLKSKIIPMPIAQFPGLNLKKSLKSWWCCWPPINQIVNDVSQNIKNPKK